MLAEKKLELFLEQIKLLNGDAYYLRRVNRAAVFGSYLGVTLPKNRAIESRGFRPKF